MGREQRISASRRGLVTLLSILLYVLGYVVLVFSQAAPLGDEDFGSIVDALPPGFVFGTATSAYQARICVYCAFFRSVTVVEALTFLHLKC